MVQTEVRGLEGKKKPPTRGIQETTYIILIMSFESSLTAVLLGVLELEAHATAQGLALKLIQLTVLTFKMGELDSSSP